MKKFICILLWILFLGVAIFLFLLVHNSNKKLVVKRVRIEIKDSLENRFVENVDIVRLLNKKNSKLLGTNVDEINKDKIEFIVNNHESIRGSEVYILTDGTLKIDILQRCPVFRVMSNKGYYIDNARECMSLSKRYSSFVPIVTGNVTKEMAKGYLFDFCSFIYNDKFWGRYIKQVHVQKNDKIILVPAIGDFKIILGSFDEFGKKLDKLKVFLDNADRNNIWGRYKFINIEYEKQVVCVK